MLILAVSGDLQAGDGDAASVLCRPVFTVVDDFNLTVGRLRLISDRFQNTISVMKMNHVLAHAQGGLSADISTGFSVFNKSLLRGALVIRRSFGRGKYVSFHHALDKVEAVALLVLTIASFPFNLLTIRVRMGDIRWNLRWEADSDSPWRYLGQVLVFHSIQRIGAGANSLLHVAVR